MITELKRFNVAEGRWYSVLIGISTDIKPSGKINGSVFKEMDTGIEYRYKESTDEWKPQE